MLPGVRAEPAGFYEENRPLCARRQRFLTCPPVRSLFRPDCFFQIDQIASSLGSGNSRRPSRAGWSNLTLVFFDIFPR